jgi:hypothetical protein
MIELATAADKIIRRNIAKDPNLKICGRPACLHTHVTNNNSLHLPPKGSRHNCDSTTSRKCSNTASNERGSNSGPRSRLLFAPIASPLPEQPAGGEPSTPAMMNGRHPPAGQGMQHDAGRRRPYNLQHSQYQPVQPVYPGYINPYNPYYQQLPAHYQHGGMPPAQYPPYPPYVRSPPPQFQQYAPTPPPVVSAYTRPQHSPAVAATPYQPPPPPPPPQPTMSPYSPNSSISVSNVPAPPTPKPIPAVIPPRPQFHPPVSSARGYGWRNEQD